MRTGPFGLVPVNYVAWRGGSHGAHALQTLRAYIAVKSVGAFESRLADRVLPRFAQSESGSFCSRGASRGKRAVQRRGRGKGAARGSQQWESARSTLRSREQARSSCVGGPCSRPVGIVIRCNASAFFAREVPSS